MIIIGTIKFFDALIYPLIEPKRLVYALLILIPILGWAILYGYIVRLTNEFIEGRYQGLIEIDIIEDLKLGFIMFLKSLPLIIIMIIISYAEKQINLPLRLLIQLLLLFIVPLLRINFLRKKTIGSYFEFSILNVIKDNLGDYISTILKQWVLSFIFLILSLLLIGIPALIFTGTIFMANFYGRNIEKLTNPAFDPS